MEGNNRFKKNLFVFSFIFSVIIFILYHKRTTADYEPEEFRIINPNWKYILQWTSPDREPFKFMGKGHDVFLEQNCRVSNCFITSNRNYLKSIANFDALLFHGPEIINTIPLPQSRLSDQKYVFASMESSHYYPIHSTIYDNFFNWTMTYKLSSDVFYGYFIIRNHEGQVIGPKENMSWLKPEEMKPINDTFKNEFGKKEMLAAWFVSNCHTPSHREKYVKEIQDEVKAYNMKIDIFGNCGPLKCPRSDASFCNRLVKESYYFYFSFENSFDEDYVTEKLLTALQNNAVPVVFGGADYSRYMPDGAYLDLKKLGVKELVRQMIDAVHNKEKYYDFFKWKNHYSYHNIMDSPETNPHCILCSKLNEMNNENNLNYYSHFREWWNKKS